LEHSSREGYISEKILAPFAADAIPIYRGSSQIFRIFNARSFVYLGPHGSPTSQLEEAVERIFHLESNATAYTAVQSEPMLVDGAFQRYFGGAWQERARELLSA
jgi:hypothetical protein